MPRVGWLKCSWHARPLHELVYQEQTRIWKRYEASRPTRKWEQSLEVICGIQDSRDLLQM